MGYKDAMWNEAPGYCVECHNLRPLNKAAVCERCHSRHPNSWYNDWQEDFAASGTTVALMRPSGIRT